jgi:hypothetical protein
MTMTTEQTTTNIAPVKAKKPSGCLTSVAVLMAILFVFLAVIGLIGFNIWRVLFNPPLVKQTLTSEVVSSDLVPATLEVFSEWRAEQRVKNNESLSGVNEPDIVLLISYLKTEDWKKIKQLLVTDDFVTHIISVSVDGLYAWLDSKDLWPAINWEMTPLKTRVAGQEGIDAIMVAYAALPVCGEAEINDLLQRLSKVPPGVEVLYNLCQFPDPWHDDQVGDYVDSLKGVDDNIPTLYNFSEELGKSSSGQAINIVLLKSTLRLVRFIAISGWVIALVILALIITIKVRSRQTLGKFVGIPLLISGALAALIALVGQPAIIQFVEKSLLAATSDFARQEIENSIKHLTSLFFLPLLIEGIILAVLGIVMIGVMFFKRRKASDQQPVA